MRLVADVEAAIEEERFPLLLTEGTDHLEILFEKLVRLVTNVFVMKGATTTRTYPSLYNHAPAIAATAYWTAPQTNAMRRMLVGTWRTIPFITPL